MSGIYNNTSKLNFVLQGEMGVAAAWVVSLETQREHRSNYLVRPNTSFFTLRIISVHSAACFCSFCAYLPAEKIVSSLIVSSFNVYMLHRKLAKESSKETTRAMRYGS